MGNPWIDRRKEREKKDKRPLIVPPELYRFIKKIVDKRRGK
jgi:hypothetical protein